MLLAIKRQGGDIKRQADSMKEQSDLMVEKERAKLRIEFDGFQSIKDSHGTYNVVGSVSIYGITEAYIERSQIYASVGVEGVFNPLPEWVWEIQMPKVIRPHSEPIRFASMVIAEDGPASDEEMMPVFRGDESVYCTAIIEFADTFGQRWVLRLRRRFRFLWPQTIDPDAGGKWEDSGPPEDNGEHRVEAEQPSKPN